MWLALPRIDVSSQWIYGTGTLFDDPLARAGLMPHRKGRGSLQLSPSAHLNAIYQACGIRALPSVSTSRFSKQIFSKC